MGAYPHGPKFYGSATVGPKGQIVIPGEARKALNINPGDKVLILGIGPEGKMLAVCPSSQVEKMLSHLTDHINQLKAAVDTKPTNEVEE